MKHSTYYRNLLAGRAKRLNELIDISAPDDLICQEILLLMKVAIPLQPSCFKTWVGKYAWPTKELELENEQRLKCATG